MKVNALQGMDTLSFDKKQNGEDLENSFASLRNYHSRLQQLIISIIWICCSLITLCLAIMLVIITSKSYRILEDMSNQIMEFNGHRLIFNPTFPNFENDTTTKSLETSSSFYESTTEKFTNATQTKSSTTDITIATTTATNETLETDTTELFSDIPTTENISSDTSSTTETVALSSTTESLLFTTENFVVKKNALTLLREISPTSEISFICWETCIKPPIIKTYLKITYGSSPRNFIYEVAMKGKDSRDDLKSLKSFAAYSVIADLFKEHLPSAEIEDKWSLFPIGCPEGWGQPSNTTKIPC